MPETESGHHRGVAAIARLDHLVAPPAAPATTTTSSCATATATARDEDEEEDGFTFAAVAVPRLQAADCAFPDAQIGPVYPVFGRPRRSPPKQQHQQEEEDPAGTGTATVRRVPLGRLLLEDRWCDCDCAPSASGQQPADAAEAELDGVPADTYCLWSPGVSPPAPAGSSRRASPARCRKSGSTGSSVLRWRRQRRRSHSDGKARFVFLGTSSDRIGAGERHGRWMNSGSAAWGGGSKSTTTSFLPCKQDLVGLVASAVTFRRSYLPF